MSRRKPPKGGRSAAPSSRRSSGSRRRKGRGWRVLSWLVLGVALFALGAYFGERVVQRFTAWRTPKPFSAEATRKPTPASPAAASRAKPKAPRAADSRPAAAAPSGSGATGAIGATGDGAGTPTVTGEPAPRAPTTPTDPTDALATSAPPAPKARVAIVIDDLGRDVAVVERMVTMAAGAELSYAVLPFESRTSEVVEALRRHGAEVLLHLPMDPEGGEDPGPGALTTQMSKRELAAATAAALAAVPGALGVNNHMGSKLSADRAAMTAILGELRRENRYFLDSRTAAGSVGFEVARELGVPSANRDLFLDDDPDPAAIAAQFALLLARAREQGAAIALAHPRPSTLAVLAEQIPQAIAAGIEFVPVSYLLERSEELPE